MSGRLVSEKRTARQVQPPSAKDGCASLMQAYERATPDRARPFNPYRGRVPRALVSGAAAQAILHECLAVGALQALAPGVRAAGLHLLLLGAALRGGRAGRTRGCGSCAGGGGRALLGQAALDEGPALGALQSLGC